MTGSCHTVIQNAFRTRSVPNREFIDQPTTGRALRSIATAKHTRPHVVAT